MTPDERCHCGHERRFHDPCSICECPFFRPAERVKAKRYKKRPVPPEADDGTAD
jgi:hypothetical protein